MARPKKTENPNLTPRQQRILDVIRDATVLRGYPPSIREIGDATGLQSTSSVSYQLGELERKGYLRRDPHKPRAFDVRQMPGDKKTKKVEADANQPEHQTPAVIPFLGQIAAGIPITAEENIEEYYAMAPEFVGTGDLFMLKVVGDSMRDAGILDGDFVVVRSQNTCEVGNFVAAMIDGEATVKEYALFNGAPVLRPHNVEYDDIDAKDASILGIVVTVLRRLD